MSAAVIDKPRSAFEGFQADAWPFRFAASLTFVDQVRGGTPSDENVAASWLKEKLAPSDDILRQLVAETMVERNVDAAEALKIVNDLKHLNGFKRDTVGLYLEGRQLKAALKEAVSVAVSAGKVEQRGWGTTRKWITSFLPEHVFIAETKLHLLRAGKPITAPDGVDQRFAKTRFGTGIKYEEFVTGASIDFTVFTDHDFTKRDWAMIWLTGGEQGLGATRSMGYGTYVVTQWKRVPAADAKSIPTGTRAPAKKTAAKSPAVAVRASRKKVTA